MIAQMQVILKLGASQRKKKKKTATTLGAVG